MAKKPKSEHAAKLPSEAEILEFMRESKGGVGKREIARAFGASQVIAVDVRDDKLEAASRMPLFAPPSFGSEFGLITNLEQRILLTDEAIFRHIPPCLAHKPDRRHIRRLTAAGAQEAIVYFHNFSVSSAG